MTDDPQIARVAALVADPARAKMIWALVDGSTRPAGELAYAANISAQSASGHLAKLVRGGLLETQAQGRHRYFRIANGEVANLIEGMASLGAAIRPRAPRPALPPAPAAGFRYARTCYGHLAGELAVRILEGMLKAKWLAQHGQDFSITPLGERKLEALGVDLAEIRSSRRVFARACVDLTQRRAHLGGALGEALLGTYARRGLIQRQRRSRRVTVTPKGQESFRRWFSI